MAFLAFFGSTLVLRIWIPFRCENHITNSSDFVTLVLQTVALGGEAIPES
jgi:hypothetical protein